MMSENYDFGKHSEQLACEFLIQNGFEILQQNYRTRLGEIDIIAIKQGAVHFVEVKARRTFESGDPFEAITAAKRSRLKRAALQYMAEKDLLDEFVQFDVLGVSCLGNQPEIELREDVFEFE